MADLKNLIFCGAVIFCGTWTCTCSFLNNYLTFHVNARKHREKTSWKALFYGYGWILILKMIYLSVLLPPDDQNWPQWYCLFRWFISPVDLNSSFKKGLLEGLFVILKITHKIWNARYARVIFWVVISLDNITLHLKILKLEGLLPIFFSWPKSYW